MDAEQITRVDELEEANQTDIVHLYCCRITDPFCGSPIKGRPSASEENCVVCSDLLKMGYTCSCGQVWR